MLRKDIHPEMLATLILAMMDGLQIQWLLNPEAVHLSEDFNHFMDRLQGNNKGKGDDFSFGGTHFSTILIMESLKVIKILAGLLRFVGPAGFEPVIKLF